MALTLDLIPQHESVNLPGLFRQRVKRSADKVAYRYYSRHDEKWHDISWREMADEVARWQAALQRENLQPGDRVGIILRNSPEWVKFDQAALGLGLVVVPLYTNDRADNIAYIVRDADIKCLLFEGEEHWLLLHSILDRLDGVQRFISLHKIHHATNERLSFIDDWVPDHPAEQASVDIRSENVASIVYTSGTTGRPKGVMLTHNNIVWNAWSCVRCEPFYTEDVYLSFLPLSHTLERTVGYYMAMTAGSTVAFARSIDKLAEDMLVIRPTMLISVPRIYERVYNKIKAQLAGKSPLASKLFHAAVNIGWQRFEIGQQRARWSPQQLLWPVLNRLVAKKILDKLGGRIRMAICGGAPLPIEIGKTFIGLGLPLVQGYGMTELSPVVAVNRFARNDPASVGTPLPEVEVRLGDKNELQVRSPGVMKGYWNNEQATAEIIDDQGWLNTGDVAKIENDFIYITGRIKDIIVMANGEKVPPTDVEMAIASDPLFDQAMVIGEGKPFLSCITVLNYDHWQHLAKQLRLNADDPASLDEAVIIKTLQERINLQLHEFPGYAKIHGIKASLEPWTIEDGTITPTMKLKRNVLMERFQPDIAKLYEGH
jgi:long-chain acyl-CoA synthetase